MKFKQPGCSGSLNVLKKQNQMQDEKGKHFFTNEEKTYKANFRMVNNNKTSNEAIRHAGIPRCITHENERWDRHRQNAHEHKRWETSSNSKAA